MNEASNPVSSEIVHGGMTLAEVAELSALARLAEPPFHEVLAARGLSNEAWNDARTAWNRAIEEELERGGDGLVVAFAEALAEAKERFRREPPSLGDRQSRVGPSSERGVEQASFQRAGVSGPHDGPIFGRPSYEKAGVDRPPPTLEAPKVGFIDHELPELESTAKVPIVGIPQRIMPFQAPPPGCTALAPSPAPPPETAKAGSPRGAGLGSTAQLSVPRVLPKPLPFKPHETAPAAAPAQPNTASSSAPAAQAAAPAQPGAAQSAPRLTPEQYASLTAELAERPDRAAEVRARYFVAQEAAWTALQAEWQQRMMADPRLRQRITDLVAHYRAWHKRAGG